MPESVAETLIAGLDEMEDVFWTNQDKYGDYSESDVSAFEAKIASARLWIEKNR